MHLHGCQILCAGICKIHAHVDIINYKAEMIYNHIRELHKFYIHVHVNFFILYETHVRH